MKPRKTESVGWMPDIALLPEGMITVGAAARADLREALGAQKIALLRVTAKARRLGIKSTQREALVTAVLDNLLDPGARAEAIGGLRQPARAILALGLLLDWDKQAITPGNMRKLLREGEASATTIDGALAGLAEKGLMLPATAGYPGPDPPYRLPEALRAGLVPLLPEAHAYTGDLLRPTEHPAAFMLSKIGSLLDALESGSYSLAGPEPRTYRGRPTRAMGRWEIVDTPVHHARTGDEPSNGIEVATGRPLMAEDDMERLRQASGLGSDDEVTFYLYILEALGLLRRTGQTLSVLSIVADTFADKTPAEAIAAVIAAVITMNSWSELDRLLAGDPTLALFRNNSLYYAEPPHMRAEVTVMRQALISVLAWLPVGAWYDVHSVLGIVRRFFPELPVTLAPTANTREQQTWWLARAGGPVGSWIYLDRHSTADWMRGLGKLLAAMIGGTLSWLGLVEATAINGLPPKAGAPPAGFRITELGGAVFSKRPDAVASVPLLPAGSKPDPKRGPSVRVRADADGLLLTLDPRATGTEDMILLGKFTAPVRVDAETCVYQMTGGTARAGFEAGLSADEMETELRRLAGDGLPLSVPQRIATWWDAYGRLRFHTGVSLISFSDEFTLTELLTTTNLGNYLLYQFSPRLVAVKSDDVDKLLDELARAGHTPRVIDESRPAETPAIGIG
ncbi:MAG: helicase-associated domain-containing protein [Chloroflexia bacterium]